MHADPWFPAENSDNLIYMEEISATEAARNFAKLLDDVEHRGASFRISRNNKVVAEISPASRPNGAAVLEFFRTQKPDPEWWADIQAARAMMTDERPWND